MVTEAPSRSDVHQIQSTVAQISGGLGTIRLHAGVKGEGENPFLKLCS
jgi:hypothetical protein